MVEQLSTADGGEFLRDKLVLVSLLEELQVRWKGNGTDYIARAVEGLNKTENVLVFEYGTTGSMPV